MAEKKFRIRIKTPWTGTLDGKKRRVKAGEEVDVDMDTARALVFQHNKADFVSVEEIIAEAKKPKKKPSGQRAARTKAQKAPRKNKMVTESKNK